MDRYRHEAEALAAHHEADYRVEIEDLDAEEFERVEAYTERTDGAVAAAIRNGDGDVLFVHSEAYGGWVLPGGGVEPGEDLRTATAREVHEETGVEATIGRPLMVLNAVARNGERTVSGYFVAFEGIAEDEELSDDPGLAGERIDDVRWFSSIPAGAADGENVQRVLDVVEERFEGVVREDGA